MSKKRAAAILFLTVFTFVMAFAPDSMAVRALPDTLHMTQGQLQALSFGQWFSCGATGTVHVDATRDETLLSATGTGKARVQINLFGLFPVRELNVEISPEKVLVPGGMAVGVALATQGVVVVGLSDINGQNPARTAGVRAGDVLMTLDDTVVESTAHLSALVAKAAGAPMRLAFKRGMAAYTVTLSPRRDSQDSVWRLGLWVRDSTAGVGTLSYYDPSDGSYGALGHAITDADTGLLLPVRTGNLLKADILDVRKGARGNPGELRGEFMQNVRQLGLIKQNTQYGIYGMADKISNPLYPQGLPIGLRDSVHTGAASILSCVSGEEIAEYAVEITQVSRQSAPAQKSMVLRVTDERLLEKTGGIVQGMSGSPILQDGRIIGAVTHVFVNDPAQGYGIFIEWMLKSDDAANAA